MFPLYMLKYYKGFRDCYLLAYLPEAFLRFIMPAACKGTLAGTVKTQL
jgi:hypothetical protein